MRLTDIARELRITTQELRRELQKTNFGIGATAHEVDDALGAGVLRFLKARVKPTLTHHRAAIIFKDDKEVPSKEVKEETPEKEPIKAESSAEEAEKDARSKVPKANQEKPATESTHISVNRRIELDQNLKRVTSVPKADLPKTYYQRPKKKKRGKGSTEDAVLETFRRHSQTGRKVRIAKVSYDAGEPEQGSVSEEIAIEREIDREHFRDQKKHRAIGQKRGTKAQPQIKPKVGVVEIPSVITVKEFAEKTGVQVADVIRVMIQNGIMATINQKIDYDTAAIVASELNVEVKKQQTEATSEELFERDLEKILQEDDSKNLLTRPPVVSVMGHVDHGKTSLLDTVRQANVMAGEAGGITQHIGAYQVEKNGQSITFLDTPGHEAFTSMRARGAKATDIAILVVAADEGVKPQTIEAIHHAQEAKIPIIVAVNKIDKPNIDINRVKGELSEHGLQPEDWGGKTIMVPVSAQTGQGIDQLLEMVLLVAELENLKANPSRLAVGTVVESHLDPSLGPVATILINTGTLKVGDDVVVGTAVGRIKVMHDFNGKELKQAPPSTPVRISGLDKVPYAGEILQVYQNTRVARQRAEEMQGLVRQREESLSGSMAERIISQISAGQLKLLKIVLKADTKGSLEAIMQALNKVKSDEVAIKVIHYGVGNITNTDVIMAAASQALVIGFHVEESAHIKKSAAKERVDVRHYTVIYKLIEDLTAILSGLLEPEIIIVELGKLEVKQIFLDKKSWAILGCKVTAGKVQKGTIARVLHDGELLFETKLESLKHVKEDVKELEKGSECGIQIKTPKPVVEGDTLEVFKVEKKTKTL